MPVLSRSVLLAALTTALLAAGCSRDRRPTEAEPTASAEIVRPLAVDELPVPDLGVPRYETTGTYPQVRATGMDLSAVNRALRATVTKDQGSYRPRALLQVKDNPPDEYTGTYDLASDPTIAVANSVLVSTMYPSMELFPGGNDGSGWVSTTVLVPSGAPVTLADLFPEGADWLRTIATLTRAEVERVGYCQPYEDIVRGFYLEGLAATPANYQQFALSPDGLDIGLDQGQIGSEACSTKRITIPWMALDLVMSNEGRRLGHAAGQGLTSAPCSLARVDRAFANRPAALRDVRFYETGMSVLYTDCVPGWALGVTGKASDPESTESENLLFRSSGLEWEEVAVLPDGSTNETSYFELAWCDLTQHGVPLAATKRLLPGSPPHPAGRTC